MTKGEPGPFVSIIEDGTRSGSCSVLRTSGRKRDRYNVMYTPCPCSTFKTRKPTDSLVPLRKCHLFIESTVHPQTVLWHPSARALEFPLSDGVEMQIIRRN